VGNNPTIRAGDSGVFVFNAQMILVRIRYLPDASEADGKFGNKTQDAVMRFQADNGLVSDGVIGPKTWPVLESKDTEKRVVYLDIIEKEKIFGSFNYTPKVAKTKDGDPITILDGWAEKNIVTVDIPQLKGVPLYTKGNKQKCAGKVRLHKKAAPMFQAFFKDIEDAGLLHLVKTYDGAFNPRFVRGSTTSLSNHSWGTAIDINGYANPLGKQPAKRGTDGSVWELVPYMIKNGIYWGGYFSRIDGMHLEIGKVI
jgi:hypothetical protein